MTASPTTAGSGLSRSARLWLPRSWTSVAVFLVVAAVMAIPALLAFGLAITALQGCVLDCSNPTPNPQAALILSGIGLGILLLPFASVRFYQGTFPASAGARLTIIMLPIGAFSSMVAFYYFPYL